MSPKDVKNKVKEIVEESPEPIVDLCNLRQRLRLNQIEIIRSIREVDEAIHTVEIP